MKKRFTESQIISILKEADSFPAEEVSRKYGIHQNTIYNWHSKYGGMEVSDLPTAQTISPKRIVVLSIL